VAVPLAARSARSQPVEMDIELLGAEARIYQLDLLAASSCHWSDRTLLQMHDLEHGRSPLRLFAEALAG
jgi:hypothetical protein